MVRHIIDRPIADLRAYETNARTHSPEQIEQIIASIQAFGFTNPILIRPDLTIVAGHGRCEAAKRMGLAEVPTLEVGADWGADQIRAYVLADNQLALNAGWDEAMLARELAELSGAEFNLELTGFDASEIDRLLGDGGEDAAAAGRALAAGRLAERFGLAPFSVLMARTGWWQDRKRAWLALGIRSELGRGEADFGDQARKAIPGGRKMPAVDRRTGKIKRRA